MLCFEQCESSDFCHQITPAIILKSDFCACCFWRFFNNYTNFFALASEFSGRDGRSLKMSNKSLVTHDALWKIIKTIDDDDDSMKCIDTYTLKMQ